MTENMLVFIIISSLENNYKPVTMSLSSDNSGNEKETSDQDGNEVSITEMVTSNLRTCDDAIAISRSKIKCHRFEEGLPTEFKDFDDALVKMKAFTNNVNTGRGGFDVMSYSNEAATGKKGMAKCIRYKEIMKNSRATCLHWQR